MQDKHLFEYAIIRIVPRVEREEFLNVGVMLYCRPLQFLGMSFTVNEERLQSFYPAINIAELRLHLGAFEQISAGNSAGGPIACLDMASRFRWLTARRSTILQTSAVHPGLCDDPGSKLVQLHDHLVKN